MKRMGTVAFFMASMVEYSSADISIFILHMRFAIFPFEAEGQMKIALGNVPPNLVRGGKSAVGDYAVNLFRQVKACRHEHGGRSMETPAR